MGHHLLLHVTGREEGRSIYRLFKGNGGGPGTHVVVSLHQWLHSTREAPRRTATATATETLMVVGRNRGTVGDRMDPWRELSGRSWSQPTAAEESPYQQQAVGRDST